MWLGGGTWANWPVPQIEMRRHRRRGIGDPQPRAHGNARTRYERSRRTGGVVESGRTSLDPELVWQQVFTQAPCFGYQVDAGRELEIRVYLLNQMVHKGKQVRGERGIDHELPQHVDGAAAHGGRAAARIEFGGDQAGRAPSTNSRLSLVAAGAGLPGLLDLRLELRAPIHMAIISSRSSKRDSGDSSSAATNGISSPRLALLAAVRKDVMDGLHLPLRRSGQLSRRSPVAAARCGHDRTCSNCVDRKGQAAAAIG